MRTTTLNERVTQICAELGINQVQLAELAGVTKGAVNQWFSAVRIDQSMKPAHAFAIADKTNYEPRWLMLGEGPKNKTNNARENALIELYRACDERGQTTVLRAAEQESKYLAGDQDQRTGT